MEMDMSFHDEMETVLNSPANYVLDSKYEIEDVLTMIQQVEDKVKFYKELKQFRAKKIDDEISNLESRANHLRRIVLNTMESTEPKKKTMHFPGVGKVTRRTGKSSWKIKNEQLMLDFLEEQGVKGQVVETKEVISKKEANKVFDCFKDQELDIPGVEYVEPSENISISFEDESKTPQKKSTQKAKSPKADMSEAIDELEV